MSTSATPLKNFSRELETKYTIPSMTHKDNLLNSGASAVHRREYALNGEIPEMRRCSPFP
jgi:hypothetical protein